jgi:ribosome-associated translation inhibitor RaiA
MKIEIQSSNEPLTDRMRIYIEAMTREVLRGFEGDTPRVVVRVWRDPTLGPTGRSRCDVRMTTRDGAELVFDGTAVHPHAAVERALEQLWQVLRARAAAPTDGRAA